MASIRRVVGLWQDTCREFARRAETRATVNMLVVEELRADYGDVVDTHEALKAVRARIQLWLAIAGFWRALAGEQE